jgi:hypothetical protein
MSASRWLTVNNVMPLAKTALNCRENGFTRVLHGQLSFLQTSLRITF